MKISLRSRHVVALAVLGFIIVARPASAQKTTITPESVQGQNVLDAAQFLEDMGNKEEADAIRQKLNDGELYYDPKQKENGDTSPGNDVTVNAGLAYYADLPSLRSKTFKENNDFDAIVKLARTLFHEDVHTNQSAWTKMGSNLKIGSTPHEIEAWSKTILAQTQWIQVLRQRLKADPGNLTLIKQLQTLVGNTISYIGAYKDNDYYGAEQIEIDTYEGVVDALTDFGQRLTALEESIKQKNAQIGGAAPAGGTATTPGVNPGGAAPPPPPKPSPPPPPPPPPPPSTPAEICPECIIHVRAVMALRDELMAVRGQMAEASAKSGANQAAQRAVERRMTALRNELKSQQGTGGFGYDPDTGITREAYTQADGTVKVTWKDSDGNIIQQYVRDRSDLTKVRNDLDAATKQLEALKAEEAAIKKERERLAAREQLVKSRLDDAIQQLARCLEEKCRNLIGLPLNTVAQRFGLDPVTGQPIGPAVGANTFTPLGGSPSAGASGVNTPGSGGAKPPAPPPGGGTTKGGTGSMGKPGSKPATPAGSGGSTGMNVPGAGTGAATGFADEPAFDLADFTGGLGCCTPGVQLMTFDLVVTVTVTPTAPGDARTNMPWLPWSVRSVASFVQYALSGANPVAAGHALSLSNAWVSLPPWPKTAPVRATGAAAAPSPLRTILTSLGTSQGEAFDMRIINDGPRPAHVSGTGVVVEPLKREAQEQLRKQIASLAKAAGVSRRVEAFCLQYGLAPPSVGTLFQIAGPELQAKYKPVANVLSAGRRLAEAGVLSPDSNPKAYVESIKQYAVWTKIENWDVKKFADVWIEKTKANAVAQKVNWTRQMETALLGAAPGRWRDIQAVLADAAAR